MKTLFISLLILIGSVGSLFAQSTDFIPGGNVIFEDNFSKDPVGDFPARWSTSSSGSASAAWRPRAAVRGVTSWSRPG
jgi:hypothetical protein